MKSEEKSKGDEKSGKRTRKTMIRMRLRPKSAYMCWSRSDEGVAKVKSENPDMNHKDAVKRASEVTEMTEQKVPGVYECRFQKEYEEKMKDVVLIQVVRVIVERRMWIWRFRKDGR